MGMTRGATSKKGSHLAVIDVGSNSVRLVVYEGLSRSPNYLFNEKVMCGLGIGLVETGKLNPDGVIRAKAALRRFRRLIDDFGITDILAVATEAIRRATDGPAFRDEILAEYQIDLRIISGDEEATLSAQGVLLGRPITTGLVCDIGGSSMELAELSKGDITNTRSSKLGPMSVDAYEDQTAFIESQLDELVADFSEAPHKLYLVGGSWRAFATLLMITHDYPLRVIHEYEVEKETLESMLRNIADSPEQLTEYPMIATRRIALLPIAAKVLLALLARITPKKIIFSSYGLREGLLFGHMDEATRQQDPLLVAAQDQERMAARFPGMGEKLFQWIQPLLGEADSKKMRLAKAACYLHDVYWASHPDYRADIAFDAVTHANLGGLGHKGRAFIAWCLMNRYKQRRLSETYSQVQYLLDDGERALAETIGQALRLGAMLFVGNVEEIGAIELSDTKLVLTLAKSDETIWGDVTQRRFDRLCEHLGRQGEIMLN